MRVLKNGFLLIMMSLVFLTACTSEEEKNAEKQRMENYQDEIKELKIENGNLKLENAKIEKELANLKKELVNQDN